MSLSKLVGYPGVMDERDKLFGEPVVVVHKVKKQYEIEGRDDAVVALKEINLNDDAEFYPIRRGEFVAILGPSGGGKTTLLNMLGTIDLCTEGEIEILGETINSESEDNFLSFLRLSKIGFVFQTFNLLATMSAYENVELPMIMLGKLDDKQRRKRALGLLELVGLRDRVNHLPSELSGGEQQRVTIARALANEPQLLLLDEPTGDLDTKNTVDIMNLILDINQEHGTTCIMVTHNPDLECYADRILYVADGKFKGQAINEKQEPLHYESYVEFLNQREQEQ
eukprot:TRINITY_DN2235_c0_g2_i7.p1 TRINITY_DN2235_c0_g2~~TRINITY_DN2235_c0_g2_i7.p1  ORF type:complete len:282 (+),score=65.25 TRINITY_DN2235_c0_g2_i7:968-1813(+)